MGLVAVIAEERISEQEGKSEEITQTSVEKNRKKT